MRVLVALDDSEHARNALEWALSAFPSAELVVLFVLDPSETGYGEYAHLGGEAVLEARRRTAEALFDDARELADSHAVSIEPETVVGRPAPEIVAYAEAHPIDLVVVGSHGRTGLSRVLLGSVAETVARRAPVPVTIVR